MMASLSAQTSSVDSGHIIEFLRWAGGVPIKIRSEVNLTKIDEVLIGGGSDVMILDKSPVGAVGPMCRNEEYSTVIGSWFPTR